MKKSKATTILFTVFITLFISGCATQQDIKLEINSPILDENINRENSNSETESLVNLDADSQNLINYKNEMGLEVRNNKIFKFGEERGEIKGNRIFIPHLDEIYSFEFNDGIDKLEFEDIEWYHAKNILTYNGLRINLPLEDDIKVTYICDSPLIKGRSYHYCQTNQKDMLSQIEFGKFYRQFSTGGDYPLKWNEIYLKKLNDKNIIFEANLNSAWTDVTFRSTYEQIDLNAYEQMDLDILLDVYKSLLQYGLIEDLNISSDRSLRWVNDDFNQEYFKELEDKLRPIATKMVNILESKVYVDKLKNDAINVKNKVEYKKIIDSFKIET